MYRSTLLFLGLASLSTAWVPPGMSERAAEHNKQQNSFHSEGFPSNSHHEDVDGEPHHNEYVDGEPHHNHDDNENLADLVRDTDHLLDDMGDVYTEKELNKMATDERVFTWFQAHDQDEDGTLDGLELLKAISHDHNYHHETEDLEEDPMGHDPHDPMGHDPHDPIKFTDPNDPVQHTDPHDPVQHTEAADRQRFRRIVKAVDKLLEEDDLNDNGYIEYSEFMEAFTTGKLDKVKIKKT